MSESHKKRLNIEDLMNMRAQNADLQDDEVTQILDQMIVLQKQVDDQQELISALEKDALCDALTGLVNRRAFESELRRSISVARRHGRKSALLLMDVDDFKSINDHFGHQAGDKVLVHVAKLLVRNTRPNDVVARLAGDEFCIILNEVRSQEDSAKKAQELSDILAKTPCILEKASLQVEVSVGQSFFGGNDEMETIIERADSDMYEQKARNKA